MAKFQESPTKSQFPVKYAPMDVTLVSRDQAWLDASERPLLGSNSDQH